LLLSALERSLPESVMAALVRDLRIHTLEESAVLYQLCHFSSKRLEEKWHNWFSTALFFYKTVTI